MSDQTIQIGVRWAFNVQIAAADVVKGFVVDHKGNVGVFQNTVLAQDGIVRFDDGGGNLWGWVDGEFNFGFSAVIDGKTLQQESTETGPSTTTKGVVDDESLQTGTVVGQFTKAIQDKINDFFTDGVVTTGIIVGGIFFAGNQLFRVEEGAVSTGTNFIDGGGFQIQKDATGDEFSRTSLREKGIVGVVVGVIEIVVRGGLWFLAVWLNTVFQTEQFPTCITKLNPGLSDVNS